MLVEGSYNSVSGSGAGQTVKGNANSAMGTNAGNKVTGHSGKALIPVRLADNRCCSLLSTLPFIRRHTTLFHDGQRAAGTASFSTV